MAPAQSHGWDSSGDDVEVAGSANEKEEGRRLEIAVEKKLTVPNFCFLSPSVQYG